MNDNEKDIIEDITEETEDVSEVKASDPAEDQTEAPKDDGVNEYEGMPKWKENLFRALPLVITLTCVGLFALGIKWVAGVFYTPTDTLYEKYDGLGMYNIVHCFQNPSSTYYIYGEDFLFNAADYADVGSAHEDAHFAHVPEVYFILNESALDMEQVTVRKLHEGNGLIVFQFDEFVLYRLEGQYGVFAPLRDYEERATSRKNDLYVVRQLLKEDRYLGFELPDDMTAEQLLEKLEKLEWHLDTEYIEDN